MLRFFRLSILSGIAFSVLPFVAAASAGPNFRLEIGPSIAGAPKVKGGVFAVRALACGDPATVKMTGTAEGIVNDKRQSVPLKLLALDTPGVFVIAEEWPKGLWVVNLTATCPGQSATASAIVPIMARGFDRSSSRLLDRVAAAAEIEAALKTLGGQGSH